MSTSTDPEIIDVKELAGLVGLSRATIRHFLRTGQLPGYKLGRGWLVDKPTILSLLQHQDTSPVPVSKADRIIGGA